jgi:hypothetical protein
MKKFVFLLLLAALGAQARDIIPLTRDPNPNPDYVTRKEWCQAHPEMGTLTEGPHLIRPAPSMKADKGLLAIVVAENLQSDLSADITQYVADLQARGYTVEQSTYSTAGTVEGLKEYLTGKLGDGLVGAVLVGELPFAWYQIANDVDGNGEFNPPHDFCEEFPCDLFLCDLDGEWADDSTYSARELPLSPGSDGTYDSHSGSRDAEIWVSRIDASQITLKAPTTLYHSYFDRIHSYREAELAFPSKGLFYVDDDWADFTGFKMELVCDTVEEVRDRMTTCPEDYKTRLPQEGLYLIILVHSDPEAHYFKKAAPAPYYMFYNSDLAEIELGYGFYNLFACSNCRWIEPDCMGPLYHFCGKGLASIGSAKAGSMIDFDVFNTALGEGKSWGDAFVELTNYWIGTYPDSGWDQFSRGWYMGMCILGDGTLDLGEQGPGVTEQKAVIRALALNVIPLARGAVDIRLSLPRTEQVHLAVFDASGRLTTTLHDGLLDAGEHSLYWNAADAPAGVYFARLVTPGSQTAKRVVLVK